MLTDEQKAAGWIEHDGGPCPVPPRSRPAVLFRAGRDSQREPSGSRKVLACNWNWQMVGTNAIIAYRPENPHD